MVKFGCNTDGSLNQTKFSEPLPWIGIYVAAASLVCLIAMAVDAVHGIRYRKTWFPCKYSSLNATSLTLVAIAVKLSVDLNTSMPRRQDQLAKLSSSVFICTIMGNSMPSLGNMENKEMFMNIIALGILVITVIVNICIQLGTGVIYVFWKEHAFIMFLMLVLLVKISFSALTVSTAKNYLELKYNKKYELALKEGSDRETCVEKLREDLMKYWMMAHTGSPQFVMGRSVTCTASGAICLLCAMTLVEAILRSYFMSWSFHFCRGGCDYKWSTTLILVTQTIAVGVGTIAPACRWFMAIIVSCPKNRSFRKEFRVEHYWIQSLAEMKEYPLTLRIRNRLCRKLAHDAKNKFLDLCIGVQIGIVLMSKTIRVVSIFVVSRILLFCNCCKGLKKMFKFRNSVSNSNTDHPSSSESQAGSKLDLRRFVLHLEGEDELVELMMKCNCDPTAHWLRMGKKRQPKYLTKLLEMSKFSQGFKGVGEFDRSDQVPSLDSEEPPNCWALPVVTLASIAVALPNVSPGSIKSLICGVNEGLMYVRLIENNMDGNKDSTNIWKAAEVVWVGVELYHKWLDVDLHKPSSLQGKTPIEKIRELAEIAKNMSVEFHKQRVNQCLKPSPSNWPVKVLAANSMYRISQTILLNHETRNDQMGEKLFEAISVMISDILGACLVNIPRLISMKSLSCAIEERADSVRNAVYILGKTAKILKILDQRTLPCLDPYQMACIDEWRSLHKQKKNPSPFTPPSAESDTASSISSDLYLNIE